MGEVFFFHRGFNIYIEGFSEGKENGFRFVQNNITAGFWIFPGPGEKYTSRVSAMGFNSFIAEILIDRKKNFSLVTKDTPAASETNPVDPNL